MGPTVSAECSQPCYCNTNGETCFNLVIIIITYLGMDYIYMDIQICISVYVCIKWLSPIMDIPFNHFYSNGYDYLKHVWIHSYIHSINIY